MQAKVLKLGILAAAITGITLGASGESYFTRSAQAQSTPPAVAVASMPAIALPNFRGIVEKYGPAVVNISVEGTVKSAAAPGQSPFAQIDPDDPFSDFLRRFGPQFQVPPGEQTKRGQGSGFIVSADGIILTNAHVVEGADQVSVKLTDKREFKATVLGVDKPTDIAVLKIEATNLPIVPLGDPAQTEVGDWVLAIGSPFGFENSVTAGIVSAKSRSLPDEGYVPFLQTDVAINPGNSGGPLINMRGEVVGINSQIYSRSGGFQGISFAIPIDEAVRVADQLKANGRVTRGRIGVQIDQVSKDVAESLGLGQPRGALVRGVEANSPASRAGVEPGDIILKFDGKAIEKSLDLPRLVGNTKPGTRSTLSIWRRGAARDLSITVAELEPDKPEQRASAPEGGTKPQAGVAAQSLGLTVAELTASERENLQIKGGVRVATAEGAAARAGLREGDVIVGVANAEVANVRQFEAVVARQDKSKPISVLIRRGEWAQYAVIRPAR